MFVMSKRNRQFNRAHSSIPTMAPSNDLAGEYRIIRSDLVRVVIVNIIFLAGLLALFYTDYRFHYLEAWFSKILHI